MGCVSTPQPPQPALPAPFSIPKLAAPPLPKGAIPCCKLPAVKLPVDLPALPKGTLNPAIVTTINDGIKVVTNWCRSRTLKCPKE